MIPFCASARAKLFMQLIVDSLVDSLAPQSTRFGRHQCCHSKDVTFMPASGAPLRCLIRKIFLISSCVADFLSPQRSSYVNVNVMGY